MKVIGQNVDASRPIDDFMTYGPHAIDADETLHQALAAIEEPVPQSAAGRHGAGNLVSLLRQQDLIEFIAEAFPQEILNLPPRPHQLMDQPEGA